MSDSFRHWLGFASRPEGDKLVIQFEPSVTMSLNREQAEKLVEHLAGVADKLPTLSQRLGIEEDGS